MRSAGRTAGVCECAYRCVSVSVNGCAGADRPPAPLRVARVTVRGALRSAGKRVKTQGAGSTAAQGGNRPCCPAGRSPHPPRGPFRGGPARPGPPEGSAAGAARRVRAEALGAAGAPIFPRVPWGLGNYLPFLNQNRSWELFRSWRIFLI